MKTRRLFIIAALVTLFLTGCATFRYGDRSFSNADNALKAQQERLTTILNKITPLEKPPYKKALIIIPDYAAIVDKSIKKSRLSTPEVVDYVTKGTINDLIFTINTIKKYNLFEKVKTIETGFPKITAKKNAATNRIVIYFYANNFNDQGWELLLSENKNKSIKLPFDTKVPAGIQRVEKWLKKLKTILDKNYKVKGDKNEKI